jgi:Tfp pilus assembly protein PilN
MFEFISGEYKRRAKHEYRMRVGTVSFFVTSFIILCSVAIAVPLLVSLNAKEKALSVQLASLKNVSTTHSEDVVRASIEKVEKKIEAITSFSNDGESIINLIGMVADVPEGIALSEIQAASTSTVSVHGIAATRNNLRAFIDSLNGKNYFKHVDLPVSGLVKQTKIDFSFDLVKAE